MKAIRKLAVALLLVAASVSLGAEPANAGTIDFCFGQGSMSTSQNFYYVGFGSPAANASYSLTMTIGGCFLGHSSTATGTLSGFCGFGTATILWDEHFGVGTWEGTAIEFHGPQVEGTISVAANSLAGHSCTTGASGFLVEVALILDTLPPAPA